MNIYECLKKSEEKLKKEQQIKNDDIKRLDEIERERFVNECKIISKIISCKENFELIIEDYDKLLSNSKILKLKFKQIFGEVVWNIAKKYFETIESEKMIIVKFYCNKTLPNLIYNNIFAIKYKFDQSCLYPNYELLIDSSLDESYDSLFDKIIKFLQNPLELYDYPLNHDTSIKLK